MEASRLDSNVNIHLLPHLPKSLPKESEYTPSCKSKILESSPSPFSFNLSPDPSVLLPK